MKIESLDIINFRSIKKATIRMHDITAIVGENNAGKTAVLRALNSVMNFKEEEENFANCRHRFAPRCNTHIKIVFTDIPPRFADKEVEGKLTIQFHYTYSNRKKQLTYLNFQNEEITLDDSFLTELKTEIIYVYIPADRTTKDTLWESDSIFQKLVSAYVAQHTENRDTISTYVRRATEKIHSAALKNLEKEINNLYLQNKSVDFKVNFPSDLDYTVLLSSVMLSMNEYGHNYLLQEWGSGTKSLAVIAMHRANALLNRASIVLGIEEPEINLHPQGQKKFIMTLRDKRHQNETQSIFTTHSTVLVDSLRHEEIILVRRKSDNRGFVSDITQITDDFWQRNGIEEFKHYQYFNYKNSDFFFAKFIIVGESKNDCQVFEGLINPAIGNKTADISYLDSGGVCNIQYPFFLLRELHIPFIMIVDKDFFFPYSNNNKLEDSRNAHTGLPTYSTTMNHNAVLDVLFSQPQVRQEIEDANRKGYRAFFDKIKSTGIVSMNYCLEMDLTCSSQARSHYYQILHIEPANQNQPNLLVSKKNAIKRIEYIDQVLKSIPKNSLPESFKKIKNHIIDMINSMVIA